MSKRRLLIVERDEAETCVLLSLFQFAFSPQSAVPAVVFDIGS